MDIVAALTDNAEALAEATDARKAISFLTIHGAENLMRWTDDQARVGPNAENGKALVNAGIAFLGAASLSGLDLESALREVALQCEQETGGVYLERFERDAAEMARDNEESRTHARAVDEARQHLARLFGDIPGFSRVR
jgi:hypothetical protein